MGRTNYSNRQFPRDVNNSQGQVSYNRGFNSQRGHPNRGRSTRIFSRGRMTRAKHTSGQTIRYVSQDTDFSANPNSDENSTRNEPSIFFRS